MITRPLELAPKLRPEPRNFDFLFWVNGGLIVLFFLLFGSRFVLAPGLGVDFELPRVPAAVVYRAPSTDYITVKRGGLLLVSDGGQISLAQLRRWLADRMAERRKSGEQGRPILLIRSDARVDLTILTPLFAVAEEMGFDVELGAETAPAESPGAP